jgi:hypothetical protein
MKVLLFFGAVMLLTVAVVHAQEAPIEETNPFSIRWQQVNSPHFKIIYPVGFESQAQRMANTLEHVYEPEARTISARPRKIPIILQNQSAISNGFVALAPRRSEFFGMPPQNYNFIGNNDWYDLLATHEYRHIVQFQKSITGFNKLVYYTLGQFGLAAMAFAAVPSWFWEGDAVAIESAVTGSGRGRIPNFDLMLRTNFLEGRRFNYHKQYLRSYKHFIPDHYVLGYHMVSHLRDKTGDPFIWDKVTQRAWSWPFIPFTFSNAIRKETGMHVRDLFNDMADTRTKAWRAMTDTLRLTPFTTVTRRSDRSYTNYHYPQVLENGLVVVQKEGIGDIETMVTLREGNEEKRFVAGVMVKTGMLSAARQRVVWNEYRFDPRWGMRTYSVLKAYDFETRKATTLSKHSRFNAAAISPDGYRVATVETTENYVSELVVLDFFSGEEWKRFPNPMQALISMPRWSDDGRYLYFLQTQRQRKSVQRIEVATGIQELVWDCGAENVGYPVPHGDYLFYNSPYSGIDNLYALHLPTQTHYRVTSSQYGAYNAAPMSDKGKIYYNEQTRNGLDVVYTFWAPESWLPKSAIPRPARSFLERIVEQEGVPDLLAKVPAQEYSTKPYSRLKGMLNVHSWGPYFTSSLTNADLGITSTDLLSTTRMQAGYQFDILERTGGWRANVSYQGFYPIIDLDFRANQRVSNEGLIEYDKIIPGDTITVSDDLTFRWDERTIRAGMRLPLITTTSRFIGNVTVSNYIGNTFIRNFENSIDGGGRLLPANLPQYFFRNYPDNGRLISNEFSLSAYRLLKRATRDINSKWGQAVFLDYSSTPFGGDFSGQQFSVYMPLFFPGLFKHHSLHGYYAYQWSQIERANVTTGTGLDNYTFRNRVPFARGQSVGRFQNFYSASVSYTFPLWYPDIAVGPLLNIQRVKATAFFDYSFGRSVFGSRISDQTYLSVGGELRFDVNVMRLLPQLEFGVRYSYGIDPSVTKFEFLIGSLPF